MKIEIIDNMEAAHYIVFQPGDGTRYALHIQDDYYGGWLVVWKEGKMLFWVNEELSEIKKIIGNSYSADMVLKCLNSIEWGPYHFEGGV
jgi:hypothetical protein